MSSFHLTVVVFTVALVALADSVSAKEYIVGDESGWALDFDYQTWAKDKVFYTGDSLVFNYAAGVHNVAKVNGTGFQQCSTASSNGIMTSGRDVIPLQTAGRKWYICGVAKHCELRNMKLVITVLPQTMAPAPSPVATSTSTTLALPTICGFVALIFAGLFLPLV